MSGGNQSGLAASHNGDGVSDTQVSSWTETRVTFSRTVCTESRTPEFDSSLSSQGGNMQHITDLGSAQKECGWRPKTRNVYL